MSFKKFYIGGPIDSSFHYCVLRSDEVKLISKRLLENEFILLYSHRQAGKSSLIKPISNVINNYENFCSINITFQSINQESFWEDLYGKIQRSYSGKYIPSFKTSKEFLDIFNNHDKNFILIIDEFDNLLNYPDVKMEFLNVLREIKTQNTTDKEYKLKGVLGIGVFNIVNLTISEENSISPFNVSHIYHLKQPTLDQVKEMFHEYEISLNRSLEDIIEDIYGRTHGHMGLTSLLGDCLSNWIISNNNNLELGIADWISYTRGNYVNGSISSSCAARSALKFIQDNYHNENIPNIIALLLSSEIGIEINLQLKKTKEILISEGIAVEIESNSIRLSAPIFRSLIISQFPILSKCQVPKNLTLFFNDQFQLDIVNTLYKSIQYINKSLLFHETTLTVSRYPVEFAYHFQLYSILSSMAYSVNWIITSEARNSAGKSRKRLDLYLANNGSKHGIEIISHGDQNSISQHFEDQANVYLKQLKLSSVLIVNFITIMPKNRYEWMFPKSNDGKIFTIHIYINQNDSTACVLKSLNTSEDQKIPLVNTGEGESIHNLMENLSINNKDNDKDDKEKTKLMEETWDTLLSSKSYLDEIKFKNISGYLDEIGASNPKDLAFMEMEHFNSIMQELKLIPKKKLNLYLDKYINK